MGNPDVPEGLSSADAILARIGPGHPAADDLILIHEYSHSLFFECLEGYLRLGLRFDAPR